MEGNKKKKRIMIRLYRGRDMDLVSLYLHDSKVFIANAEKALEAVVAGTEYKIPVPKPFKNNYQGYVRQILNIHLEVSSAVLRKLGELKPRMIQSYINTCIRNCLEKLPTENFFKGDGLIFNKIDDELSRMPVTGEDTEKPAADTKPAGTTRPRKKKEPEKTAEPAETEKPKLFKTFKKPAKRKLTDDDLKTIAELEIEKRGRETKARKAAEEAARQAEEKRLKAEAEEKKAKEQAVAAKTKQASATDFPAMPIKPITDDEPAAIETVSAAKAPVQEEFPPLPIKPMVDDTSSDDDDDDDFFSEVASMAHMN